MAGGRLVEGAELVGGARLVGGGGGRLGGGSGRLVGGKLFVIENLITVEARLVGGIENRITLGVRAGDRLLGFPSSTPSGR